MALPLSFVGRQNWHVIQWISHHQPEIVIGSVVLIIVLCVVLIIVAIRPIDLWNEWKNRKFFIAIPALWFLRDYLVWPFEKIVELAQFAYHHPGIFLLRWLSISIFTAVIWSIWMTLFGHRREDD